MNTLTALLTLTAALCLVALWMTLECHAYGCGRLPTRLRMWFTKFDRFPAIRWELTCSRCAADKKRASLSRAD